MKNPNTIIILIILLFNVSCNIFKVNTRENNPAHEITIYSYFDSSNLKYPTSWVNDYEDVLTSDQRNYLDSVCHKYQDSTSNQIFIITIASIGPYESLQDFTTDLGNYWGAGQAEKDNGLIITFSKERKEIWIGTGYGTEKVLTDEILKNIIDDYMIPMFKQGYYYNGIKNGLEKCIEFWN